MKGSEKSVEGYCGNESTEYCFSCRVLQQWEHRSCFNHRSRTTVDLEPVFSCKSLSGFDNLLNMESVVVCSQIVPGFGSSFSVGADRDRDRSRAV